MSVVTRDEPRLLAWAWFSVGMIPVLLGAAALIAVGVRGSFVEATAVGGVIASALALVGPTAAVALGFVAVRRRERFAPIALVVGLLCLVASAALVPLVIRSPVVLAMSAIAYAIAMFGVIVFVQSIARRH